MENFDFGIIEIDRIVERTSGVSWSLGNMHYEDEYVVVIALEGEAQYTVNQQKFTAKKGDVLFFAPGSKRMGNSDPLNPWGFISIIFRMEMNEEAKAFFDKPFIIWENVSDVVRQRFNEAIHAWTGKNPLYKVKCKNLTSEILYEIALADMPYHQVPHIKKLEVARTFIQENFRTEISVDKLAKDAGLSVAYFRRLFREAYGCAPMQYIMNLRINNARDLLLSGEVNVTEAAHLSGFDDIYYFSTQFKRKTGTTPTQMIRKI